MKKIITLFIFAIFTMAIYNSAFAQQGDFGWRVGGGVGYMVYYGDLSQEVSKSNAWKFIKDQYSFNFESDQRTYSVFVERRLTPGTSLMFTGSKGSIFYNDRNKTDNPFFSRSLNFKTDIRDLNASFVLKTDNDKILDNWFILAPYLYFGGGVSEFKTFADLKDAKGNFYEYEQGTNITQDGNYETELTELGASGTDKYATLVPHVNAGLGIRLNLFRRFSLHLQSDIKYAFSDFLDDVSSSEFKSAQTELQAHAIKPNTAYTGERGSNNKLNDFYATTTVSLRFNFGRKKETFIPPVFYASLLEPTNKEQLELVANKVAVGNDTVIVYDTIKITHNGYNTTIDSTALGKAKIRIDSLEKINMNNQMLNLELAEKQREYNELQANLAALKHAKDSMSIAQQKEMLLKLETIQKDVTDLSISSNSKINEQKIDSTQLKQLANLRAEIEKLKTQGNQQVAKNEPQPSLLPASTNNTTLLPAYNYSSEEAKIANERADISYQRLQADVTNLSAQIAALTNLIAANAGKTTPAPTYYPPMYYPPQPAATNNNSEVAALNATIEGLKSQLQTMNNRMAAIESRPIGNNNTPVVVNTPANSNDNAAMLNMLQDLRNQLNNLNNKVTTLENKPLPAPQTKIVTVEKPYVVNQTVPQPLPTNTTSYIKEVNLLGNVSIYFDVNSTVVKPSEVSKITKIVDILRRYPEAKLTISGYADNTGNADYNRKLSEKRAQAVYDRITQSYGVKTTQVKIGGFGATNDMKGDNPSDRRVDIFWEK